LFFLYVCDTRGSTCTPKEASMEHKIPLKIKIFLWYLLKGVTHAKDNLAKRNWQGITNYCFCRVMEMIQDLFFDCHFTRFIWNAVYITFGIQPLSSFANMFDSWLNAICPKLRNQIFVGVAALCWAMWLNRNDMVFNISKYNTHFYRLSSGQHIGFDNGSY